MSKKRITPKQYKEIIAVAFAMDKYFRMNSSQLRAANPALYKLCSEGGYERIFYHCMWDIMNPAEGNRKYIEAFLR